MIIVLAPKKKDQVRNAADDGFNAQATDCTHTGTPICDKFLPKAYSKIIYE